MGSGTRVNEKATMFVALPDVQIFSCLNSPQVAVSLRLILSFEKVDSDFFFFWPVFSLLLWRSELSEVLLLFHSLN